MAESDGAWGHLAEHDDEMAQAWDALSPLPEAGENPVLDAFLERKNLSLQSVLRLGAKLADGDVIAFGYDRGIKYRSMLDGKMWSYLGSEWPHMKIVRAGEKPTEQIIVCEGETDGARLATEYDCDVGIMPGGARNFPESMGQQLDGYKQVLLGLDKDEAGEAGCEKIRQYHKHTVRFPAPGAGDWSDAEGDKLPPLPALEQADERDLSSELLVPAGVMLEMEVPEVASWLEHAILPIGGQMILHGWAKSFKTFSALDLVTRLAQGQDWCCFEPTEEPIRVGIVQFEITWPYYHQRMLQLRAAAPEPDLFNENVFTWTPMMRPQLVAGNRKLEDRMLKAFVEAELQIVLIDPIRRAIGQADLNAENEVRKMLGFFQRIQDQGITVIATHHDNKEGARAGGGSAVNMTGSGSFAGDADTIVSVELPRGESLNESKRRNFNFLLRNAPSIGARSMEIQEDGHIVYDRHPYNPDEVEAADLGDDAVPAPSI